MTRGRHAARGASLTVAVVVSLAVGTGAGWAFWSATGGGSAVAASGTAQPLGATLTVTGMVYPAGPALPATLVLSNPNRFPVRVTAVTPGALTVTGGTACTAGTSAVSFATSTGSWLVPARTGVDGALTVTLPGVVTMGAAAADGCQGATFSASALLTAASA